MKDINNHYILSRILTKTPEGYAIRFTAEEMEWINAKWAEQSFLEGHMLNKDFMSIFAEQIASEALQEFAEKKKQTYQKGLNTDDLMQAIDLMGKSAALTVGDSSRLYELAELLEEAGRAADAKDIYQQFLKEFPEWFEGYQRSLKQMNDETATILKTRAENMRKTAQNKIEYLKK